MAGDNDPRRSAPQREDRPSCAGCSRVSRPGCSLIALAGTTGSVAWAEPPEPRPTGDATPTAAAHRAAGSRERSRTWAESRTGPQLGGRPSRLIMPHSSAGPAASISAAASGSARSTSSSPAATWTPAFVTSSSHLPHEQAVDLYDEVVERIQTNYVDPVPLEPLVRHGLDNLEVALRDPVFVKTNAPAATARASGLAARCAAPVSRPVERSGPVRRHSPGTRRAVRPPGKPSGWRQRRSCWNSPAARATPLTISPAT